MRDTLRRLRRTGYEAVQLGRNRADAKNGAPPDAAEGMAAPTSHERAAELVGEPERVIDRLLALDSRHTACPVPPQQVSRPERGRRSPLRRN
ncbi:MAG: hypothetical protein V8T86_08420 [Victivallis sp.]